MTAVHRVRLSRLFATPKRVFVIAFVLVFVMIASWSLAEPLFSGPDEPAHVARAVSLWRGELVGTSLPNIDSAYVVVKIPDLYTNGVNFNGTHVFPCYTEEQAYPYPPRSAACQQLIHSTQIVATETSAGRYPPFYYLLVGSPTFVTTSITGLYLMRFASGAICALFIALAVMATFAWSRRRLLFLGILLAVTPMVLFCASVVNPSALEIAASLCLWCSGLILALEQAHDPPRGLVAIVTVSAIATVLSRPLSPLWVGMTLVILMLLAGRVATIQLLRRRSIQFGGIGIALAAVIQVVWVKTQESGYTSGQGAHVGFSVPAGSTELHILATAFGGTGAWIEQMVGVFGWVDTYSPLITYLIWFVGVGMLFVLAVVVSRLRQVAVLALLTCLVIAVPVLIDYSVAKTVGLEFWQGRYTLPLSVGIPLLVAVLVDASGAISAIQSRLVGFLCCLIVVGGCLTFAQSLRRYAVGVLGPINYQHGGWQPPVVGALSITVIYVLATLFFTGYVGYLGGRRPPSVDALADPDLSRSIPGPPSGMTSPPATTAVTVGPESVPTAT